MTRSGVERTGELDADGTAIWGTPLSWRIGFGIVGVSFALLGVLGLVAGIADLVSGLHDDATFGFELGATGVVGAGGVWVAVFRPFVAIYDGDIIVRNLRTVRIPRRDIARFEPLPSGLRITTRDGCVVTVWAVPFSLLADGLGLATRAYEVADALRQAHRPPARTRRHLRS
ncbi:MAG: hypothetical protein JWO68_1831 [Actinomycetia bacterium]|nr:hypothetical protein [Actinomycetes bacterium]